MEDTRAEDVMRAMVAMFASGDPSRATDFVDESYLDHQGLGDGPLRGVDGGGLFAMLLLFGDWWIRGALGAAWALTPKPLLTRLNLFPSRPAM